MLRNLVKRVKERIDLGYIEQPLPAQLTNRGAERFQKHYFGSKAILVSGDTLNDSSLVQNSQEFQASPRGFNQSPAYTLAQDSSSIYQSKEEVSIDINRTALAKRHNLHS